jgi:hypothetical protein
MSQPHPPIPEPQPHTAGDDDPRTQSILLPPSQRPSGQPDDVPPAADFPQPDTGQFPRPGAQHAPAAQAHDVSGTQVTGPVDFVPGFDAGRPPAGPPPVNPVGSSAATPPRPASGSGPVTSPGSPTGGPAGPRRSPLAAVRRAGRGGTALISLLLGVLALVVLQVGLVRDFGNQSLWEVVPTWSTLATLATLVVLVPAVAGLTGRLPVRTAWQVGAAGVAALAVVWVLVALPLAASDRGFWLTAALAAAAGALWTAPGRSE